MSRRKKLIKNRLLEINFWWIMHKFLYLINDFSACSFSWKTCFFDFSRIFSLMSALGFDIRIYVKHLFFIFFSLYSQQLSFHWLLSILTKTNNYEKCLTPSRRVVAVQQRWVSSSGCFLVKEFSIIFYCHFKSLIFVLPEKLVSEYVRKKMFSRQSKHK